MPFVRIIEPQPVSISIWTEPTMWRDTALRHPCWRFGGGGHSRAFGGVLGTWRAKSSSSVMGKVLACGHLLPEEGPSEVLSEFQIFFGRG